MQGSTREVKEGEGEKEEEEEEKEGMELGRRIIMIGAEPPSPDLEQPIPTT